MDLLGNVALAVDDISFIHFEFKAAFPSKQSSTESYLLFILFKCSLVVPMLCLTHDMTRSIDILYMQNV